MSMDCDDIIEYTEEYFLHLLDNHRIFSREDISNFLDLCELIDERQYDEPRRWSRFVTSICQIGDRYFSVDWDQGLTEYQENEYMWQPYEVTKHEYEKTIIVTEWQRVDNQ